MSKVEKMRQAILEGINLSRPPPPPPPLPPPAFLPPAMVPPFYPMPPLYPPRPMGGMPPHHHPHHPHHPAQHRPRAFPGTHTCTHTPVLDREELSQVVCCQSCPSVPRHPVHPPPGREAGDRWHGGGPVGWEQTSAWERRLQHAGGVSGSRERVSEAVQQRQEQCVLLCSVSVSVSGPVSVLQQG